LDLSAIKMVSVARKRRGKNKNKNSHTLSLAHPRLTKMGNKKIWKGGNVGLQEARQCLAKRNKSFHPKGL